jgi:hypothetical protein
MSFPVAILYTWGRYMLPDYDAVLAFAMSEGTAPIETINKVMVSEAEYKKVASFYYCRT